MDEGRRDAPREVVKTAPKGIGRRGERDARLMVRRQHPPRLLLTILNSNKMKTKVNLTEKAKNGKNGEQLVYVIDCIKESSRAADEDKEFNSDAEALQFFFNCFEQEFNFQYNKRMFPSLAERIGEYLKGLPSCCNIDYTDYNVLSLGVKWGVLSSTDDKKASKFLGKFFTMCGVRILQAAQKVRLNPYKYAF